MSSETVKTTCCIAGGGPAGMVLGYLLARAGVPVIVCEKHGDFNRDFRGDTVHPSTLDVIQELGLLDGFLKVPHQKVTAVGARLGDFAFQIARFRHVPAYCRFTALMPQWDFLNFLASNARQFPSFELRMEHEVSSLIYENGRVTGVEAQTPQGTVRILADLVVGCDGRHATTRDAAHLALVETGVPIDILWFQLSRRPGDPDQVFGNVNYGKALILIDRGDHYQAGLIVKKGSFAEIKAQGLESFRKTLLDIAPYLEERVEEIHDWDQVKLLTVQIDHLNRWHSPGLLCIGDAAHAMSPAGGVGINLAIQDAVATANILADALKNRRVTGRLLADVQARREFPTRLTQRVQIQAHKGFEYVFAHPGPITAPWQLKAITKIPGLQDLMGRFVGMGVRPEHVRQIPAARSRPPIGKLAIGAGIVAAACLIALRARRTKSA